MSHHESLESSLLAVNLIFVIKVHFVNGLGKGNNECRNHDTNKRHALPKVSLGAYLAAKVLDRPCPWE